MGLPHCREKSVQKNAVVVVVVRREPRSRACRPGFGLWGPNGSKTVGVAWPPGGLARQKNNNPRPSSFFFVGDHREPSLIVRALVFHEQASSIAKLKFYGLASGLGLVP